MGGMRNKWRSIPLPHWGTLISSILIVAAYPPWDLRVLAYFCLVPWLFALTQARTWREAAQQGLWLSILMSLLGFHWVAYVLHQFGMLPWAVAIIGLFLYSLIGQPQFLLFGATFFVFSRARKLSSGMMAIWGCIGLALLYTGIDWVIPKLFRDTLGHAFYSATWIRQIAEIGGPHLLTFAAMWMNLAIFVLLGLLFSLKDRKLHLKATSPIAWLNLGLVLALFGTFALFGNLRMKEWRERLSHPESVVQAGVIQANIGDFDKVAAERGMQQAAEKILADYFGLSESALKLPNKPDFIVWPETAYASTFSKPMTTSDFSRDQRIEAWVKDHQIPLLFGSYDRSDGKDFNTFFILTPPAPVQPAGVIHASLNAVGPNSSNSSSGNSSESSSGSENLQIYHKNILLMFGEYIPLQDALPFIGKLFPQVANFGRGPGPEVFKVPVGSAGSPAEARFIPMSPAICYEVLFPNYVLEAARKGSRLIMNVTNDSWFGPYGEPHLHLALSVFRTIETRLPMVRSTNTGFSALITQDGEIASKSALFQPEILNLKVPLIEPPSTLIKSWGDWFGQFSLIAGTLVLLLLLKLNKHQE
jgi:apolipoprotein N-acyltransferase